MGLGVESVDEAVNEARFGELIFDLTAVVLHDLFAEGYKFAEEHVAFGTISNG